MASARKIAANRRNAAKSTGPKSEAAKRRTRYNARRHGLAAQTISDADRLARVEVLARELAGDTNDCTTLELARTIADAELDLEHIRRLKAISISTAASSNAVVRGEVQLDRPTAPLTQMLPELLKLDRYERRAVSRRDNALGDLKALFLTESDASRG